MNNIEYINAIWNSCDWASETKNLFKLLNMNKSIIGYNTELELIGMNEYGFIKYYINCSIDSKMEQISKIINNYLAELISDRLTLSSFINISNSYKLTDLKKRNEKTRLLKTQYL